MEKTSKKPTYIKHRERLRKRYLESGIESLQDYEKLELLLTYAISRKDVKPIGKELLDGFENIRAILDADLKDIKKVDGIGEKSAVLIKLVRDLCTVYLHEKVVGKDVFTSPEKVYDFCRLKLGSNKNEYFMVLFVSSKNELIHNETLSVGTIDNVPIYPRTIIKLALEKNASGVILVHNHPSGNTSPSDSDKKITKDLVRISNKLDIRVLDHVIVSKDSYFSFIRNNLL